MMRIRHKWLSYFFYVALGCLSFAHHSFAFNSAEHLLIGDHVHIHLPGKSSQAGIRFSLPNGLQLSYGEILALAGDFFTLLDKPIYIGKTAILREEAFLEHYHTLSSSHQALKQAPKLVSVFNHTLAEITQINKEGGRPSQWYERLINRLMQQYNVITGGGSRISPWLPLGRSTLELISPANADHFVPHALTVYRAGHSVAIKTALAAHPYHGTAKGTRLLKQAYAMNAFAGHYLSDAFSSGHMRTPRDILAHNVKSAVIATLLMDYMHGEDSRYGLHIGNHHLQQWTAYGDSYYLDEENKQNRLILDQVMQLSADEIYQAYQSGRWPSSQMLNDLLPDFSALGQQDEINHAPMFHWNRQTHQLEKRQDLSNLSCYQWSDNWWGWTSLLALSLWYQPFTPLQQVLLQYAGIHMDYHSLPTAKFRFTQMVHNND